MQGYQYKGGSMMSDFNLEDYETVKSRKKRFYEDHPGGRIIVELLKLDETEAQFKALVYKTSEDQRECLPWATGHAQEFKGEGGFANRFSWCENCEESAVGRALDNAGYSSNGRCSREEMQKVERAANSKTKSKDELARFAQTIDCPQCGHLGMVIRESKRGPFAGCDNYPECKGTRSLDEMRDLWKIYQGVEEELPAIKSDPIPGFDEEESYAK
jgi:hypothetical protein